MRELTKPLGNRGLRPSSKARQKRRAGTSQRSSREEKTGGDEKGRGQTGKEKNKGGRSGSDRCGQGLSGQMQTTPGNTEAKTFGRGGKRSSAPDQKDEKAVQTLQTGCTQDGPGETKKNGKE